MANLKDLSESCKFVSKFKFYLEQRLLGRKRCHDEAAATAGVAVGATIAIDGAAPLPAAEVVVVTNMTTHPAPRFTSLASLDAQERVTFADALKSTGELSQLMSSSTDASLLL